MAHNLNENNGRVSFASRFDKKSIVPKTIEQVKEEAKRKPLITMVN